MEGWRLEGQGVREQETGNEMMGMKLRLWKQELGESEICQEMWTQVTLGQREVTARQRGRIKDSVRQTGMTQI